MTESKPTIGVDLDGVLADQIDGVLPRLKERYGIELTYEDVIHWRLPVGPSDIATEIVEALAERDYVESMPVHVGAVAMLDDLGAHFNVVVLTAREGKTLDWSRAWLSNNGLKFDQIVGSTEAKKSRHGVAALVDDYHGNVDEFLRNTRGAAVLVDQPWNRDERTSLEPYVAAGRLRVVTSLDDVTSSMIELLGSTQR
jgi:5'(3')-deoxyribonucleotidase